MTFKEKLHSTFSFIHENLRYEGYYWRVGYYGLLIAGIAHFVFLLLFLSFGWYLLAAINVVSVMIYTYAVFGLGVKTLESKDDGLIGWLVYVELIGHNVVATYYLGSDAGFQYYIYVLAALPFFIATYSLPVYIIRVASALGIAVFLDMSPLFDYPMETVDMSTLHWLHLMNTAVAFGAMFFLFYLYLRKEKEYHHDLLEEEDLYDKKSRSALLWEKRKNSKK